MTRRYSLLIRALPFFAAAVMLAASPRIASADLIYVDTIDLNAAGLGNVSTIMSIKPKGNGTAACGQILFDDVETSCNGAGNTQFNGGSNNQTYTFGELGLTDAAEFGLFFNVNEADDSIVLNELTAYFYLPNGTLYHTATYMGPTTFEEVGGGIGSEGHLFALSAAQQTAVNSQFNVNNVVGLKASLSSAGGGFETFNVAIVETEAPPTVPEPASMTLFGMGVAGFVAAARRRRHGATDGPSAVVR